MKGVLHTCALCFRSHRLQTATAGLSNWLKSYYRLNSAEIATVLASSIHYDIASVVDPKIHVVAKIKKRTC